MYKGECLLRVARHLHEGSRACATVSKEEREYFPIIVDIRPERAMSQSFFILFIDVVEREVNMVPGTWI